VTRRGYSKYFQTLLVLLTVLVALPNLSFVYAPTASQAIGSAYVKALAIGAEFVVGDRSGGPTFSALKSAGFSAVGTIAYSKWTSKEWNLAKTWIGSAKDAGFVTFINFWGDVDTSLKMVKLAAWAGVDVIALDELLGTRHFSQSQLLSVMEAGLRMNGNLSYIINEYGAADINNAYAWTVGYPVQVATDNYSDKNVIDIGIQLAENYGRKPAAWLIFAKGSADFPCYLNLDEWVSYAKQRSLDVFFWYVDGQGTWQEQWEKVATY
jgi:hypothetical protein